MTTRFNPGDIVRCTEDDGPIPSGAYFKGDLFVMERAGLFRDRNDNARTGLSLDKIELIARAGEPVRYRPGDVVECFAVKTTDGGFTEGLRYPVTGTEAQPQVLDDRGNLRYIVASAVNVHGSMKLVHRPAKTEPLVFAPPEPQVGDRVRVIYEGTNSDVRKTGIVVDLDNGSKLFAAANGGTKIEIIERAEKPLAVGDRVRYTPTNKTGTVKGVDRDSHGEMFWLLLDTGLRRSSRRQYLERVS